MNRRHITLHFGAHKTGSTSIQHSLYGLSNDQWHVLNTRKGGNESISVNTAFRSIAKGMLPESGFSGDDSAIKDAYHRQIMQSEAQNFLLSAEAIESLNGKDLQSVYDFFLSQDLKVTFAGYMRPVTSCINSIFQQRIKGSPNFANKGKTIEDLATLCRPHYSQFYAELKQITSSTSIRLFGFDPISFPDKNVVVDFCIRLGIPIEYKRVKHVNASLSMTSVKLLWINDKRAKAERITGNKRLEFVRALVRDFSDMPQFLLSQSILNQQAEAMESELQHLNQEIETYGEFSLSKRLSKNSLDNSDYISDLSDLEIFTDAERQKVATIINGGSNAPKDGCSDNDLASLYRESVFNNTHVKCH